MSAEADIATQARRLREQTCKLLGLDPNGLTLAQQLRVNRASALRLQIDDLEAAQLRGQPIDIHKLVEASESLERLLGGNPEAAAVHDFAGAKEELARLLDQRANAVVRKENAETARLHAEIAHLREENARLAAKLKAEPQPAPPSVKQSNNVVSIDGTARANTTKPPDNYLAEHRHRNEPWRDTIYGGGGVLIAPPVFIDPRK